MTEKPTNTTNSELSTFLSRRYVQSGCNFNYLSLGRPGGRFYIEALDVPQFIKLYCNALDNNDDLYLSERNRHIGPVKVDFDFKFNLNVLKECEEKEKSVEDEDKKKVIKHLKTKNIEEIVLIYVQTLRNIFEISDEDDHLLTAYVTERKGTVVTPDNQVKEGFHLMFPHIVSKASTQYVIRNTIIPKLAPIFERMNCSNSAEDIVDEAIIERNNWMMYGSKKYGREPYLLTKIFQPKIDSRNLKEEEVIKLNCVKVVPKTIKNSDYVELFSIRNKYDETHVRNQWLSIINDFEIEQEERRKKMEISKEIIMENNNESKNESSDLDFAQVEKLVKILKTERFDNYESWIRVGWCLRNIDHRLLDVWDDASKRSKKYIEGECQRCWIKMRKCGLGLGTLHMWAKHDDPDAYKDIVHNELRTLIKNSLKGDHTDIAHVVHFMYQHKYVCTSFRYKQWFEFKDHRWVLTDNGVSLRKKISSEVWAEYTKASIDWSRRAMNMESEDEQIQCQSISKKLSNIASKLKNKSFKESIMGECMELFYTKGFEELLDNDNSLIGFENGIYNLDTGEFRDGRPEDYVSLSTQCNYVEYNPNHPFVIAIRNYMSQVFTKPDVREYVFKLFSTFLHGSVKNQKFYIWTGSGSNSKSLLVDFFMRSFGQYCCIFPVTLLTMKRHASNEANNEIALAKGKRFALMSEPSEDEKLNVGLMKELTGGDKITARKIYHEPIEFTPQFKMVLCCNNLPSVPSDDGGTWRRIRVVEFTSKFVENPQEENEFPIDYDLSSAMVQWRPYFMSMLLHYYKLYKVEGMQEPEDVLKCTCEYKRNNDHMSDYIYTCIEKKEGHFLSLNDAFAELKSWVREDNISMRIPTKPELEKYLSRVLTKSVLKNNVKCYPGYKLKTQSQIINDDNPENL